MFAFEVTCNFEEVYSDGSIQKGLILIKDKSIRYQYKDKQLFTIIHHKGNTFAVRNDDLSIVQKIDQNQGLCLDPKSCYLEPYLPYPVLINDNQLIFQNESLPEVRSGDCQEHHQKAHRGKCENDHWWLLYLQGIRERVREYDNW